MAIQRSAEALYVCQIRKSVDRRAGVIKSPARGRVMLEACLWHDRSRGAFGAIRATHCFRFL
jgi:hypothetical protein